MKRADALRIREILLEAGAKFTDSEITSRLVLLNKWAVGVAYNVKDRVRYNDRAYRCLQAHTSQDDWTPNVAQSLWEVIDVEHAGTLDDPIEYHSGMMLEKDKYYTDAGVLYLCTRDSGNAVYHALSDLVKLYVEKVE